MLLATMPAHGKDKRDSSLRALERHSVELIVSIQTHKHRLGHQCWGFLHFYNVPLTYTLLSGREEQSSWLTSDRFDINEWYLQKLVSVLCLIPRFPYRPVLIHKLLPLYNSAGPVPLQSWCDSRSSTRVFNGIIWFLQLLVHPRRQ